MAAAVSTQNSGVFGFNQTVTISLDATGCSLLVAHIGAAPSSANLPFPTPTYNGTNMTLLDDAGQPGGDQGGDLKVWYMLNPPSGSHNYVADRGAGGLRGTAGIIGISGSDTSAPFRTHSTAAFFHASVFSRTIAGDAADLGLDIVMALVNGGTYPIVAGSGQTQLYTLGDNAEGSCSASSKASAGSLTMSDTFTNSGSGWWCGVTMSIQAPIGGSDTSPAAFRYARNQGMGMR